MKIDVCIPTWNNGRFLKRCLESVQREVDVNRIIVVDKYSTDNTVSILEQHNNRYGNIKITQSKETLGVARQILINSVETEYFLFIDGDVELKPGYMATVSKYMKKSVGATESLVELTDRLIAERYTRGLEKLGFETRDPRGFTHCTLVWKKSVEGIEIPKERYAFEDKYIRNFIEKQGYEWIVSKEKMAIHYNDHGSDFDILRYRFKGGMAYRDFVGELSIAQQIKYILRAFYYGLLSSYASKEIIILPYTIMCNLLFLCGYHYKKNKIQEHLKLWQSYK